MCKKCKNSYECGGECWINVAGDPAVWDVLSDHCKGTLNEQKMMDTFFSGRSNKNKIYNFYNLSDKEKDVIENN